MYYIKSIDTHSLKELCLGKISKQFDNWRDLSLRLASAGHPICNGPQSLNSSTEESQMAVYMSWTLYFVYLWLYEIQWNLYKVATELFAHSRQFFFHDEWFHGRENNNDFVFSKTFSVSLDTESTVPVPWHCSAPGHLEPPCWST